jgi:hypothetical protein
MKKPRPGSGGAESADEKSQSVDISRGSRLSRPFTGRRHVCRDCGRWRHIRSEIKLRELREQIREALRSRNRRKAVVDDIYINLPGVKGRPSYDMPALRQAALEAGVRVDQLVTVGEPSSRLTIRPAPSGERPIKSDQTKQSNEREERI